MALVTAAVWVQSLAQEILHAIGVVKKKRKERNLSHSYVPDPTHQDLNTGRLSKVHMGSTSRELKHITRYKYKDNYKTMRSYYGTENYI